MFFICDSIDWFYVPDSLPIYWTLTLDQICNLRMNKCVYIYITYIIITSKSAFPSTSRHNAWYQKFPLLHIEWYISVRIMNVQKINPTKAKSTSDSFSLKLDLLSKCNEKRFITYQYNTIYYSNLQHNGSKYKKGIFAAIWGLRYIALVNIQYWGRFLKAVIKGVVVFLRCKLMGIYISTLEFGDKSFHARK